MTSRSEREEDRRFEAEQWAAESASIKRQVDEIYDRERLQTLGDNRKTVSRRRR